MSRERSPPEARCSIAVSPKLDAWLDANLKTLGRPLGAGYQAEVWRISTPDGEVAVKQPRSRGPLGWLTRAAIRRELEAYRQLAGIPGIPRVYGLTRAGGLVLEFIEGTDLRAGQPGIRDRDAFYKRLLATIRAMHEAGVAHGDLKRKENVIVAADERPYIIDFGIACLGGRSRLDDLMLGFTRQLDLNAWVKLKHGRDRTAMPPEDALLYRPQPLERIARWLRIAWQTLTLRRPRQRLRRRLAKRRSASSDDRK